MRGIVGQCGTGWGLGVGGTVVIEVAAISKVSLLEQISPFLHQQDLVDFYTIQWPSSQGLNRKIDSLNGWLGLVILPIYCTCPSHSKLLTQLCIASDYTCYCWYIYLYLPSPFSEPLGSLGEWCIKCAHCPQCRILLSGYVIFSTMFSCFSPCCRCL